MAAQTKGGPACAPEHAPSRRDGGRRGDLHRFNHVRTWRGAGANNTLRDEDYDADHPRGAGHIHSTLPPPSSRIPAAASRRRSIRRASSVNPRQIEGTQFGSIQCAVIPPEFFVGVDQRFEVLAAPGLIGTVKQGQGVAADPKVLKAMLALGADKGLLGAGLFFAEPAEVVSKTLIRHLSDFKGKKLRIFASEFQSEAFKRLGATPVAMSPGDVLPAI